MDSSLASLVISGIVTSINANTIAAIGYSSVDPSSANFTMDKFIILSNKLNEETDTCFNYNLIPINHFKVTDSSRYLVILYSNKKQNSAVLINGIIWYDKNVEVYPAKTVSYDIVLNTGITKVNYNLNSSTNCHFGPSRHSARDNNGKLVIVTESDDGQIDLWLCWPKQDPLRYIRLRAIVRIPNTFIIAAGDGNTTTIDGQKVFNMNVVFSKPYIIFREETNMFYLYYTCNNVLCRMEIPALALQSDYSYSSGNNEEPLKASLDLETINKMETDVRSSPAFFVASSNVGYAGEQFVVIPSVIGTSYILFDGEKGLHCLTVKDGDELANVLWPPIYGDTPDTKWPKTVGITLHPRDKLDNFSIVQYGTDDKSKKGAYKRLCFGYVKEGVFYTKDIEGAMLDSDPYTIADISGTRTVVSDTQSVQTGESSNLIENKPSNITYAPVAVYGGWNVETMNDLMLGGYIKFNRAILRAETGKDQMDIFYSFYESLPDQNTTGCQDNKGGVIMMFVGAADTLLLATKGNDDDDWEVSGIRANDSGTLDARVPFTGAVKEVKTYEGVPYQGWEDSPDGAKIYTGIPSTIKRF